MAHKDVVKKITLVQKFWVEKVLSLNISKPKKNILQKICLKEILGLPNVWVRKKIWVKKIFWVKKILGQKTFWVKKNFGSKETVGKNKFWSKNSWVHKRSGAKKFYVTKMLG